jgi:hypothetical protein
VSLLLALPREWEAEAAFIARLDMTGYDPSYVLMAQCREAALRRCAAELRDAIMAAGL